MRGRRCGYGALAVFLLAPVTMNTKAQTARQPVSLEQYEQWKKELSNWAAGGRPTSSAR